MVSQDTSKEPTVEDADCLFFDKNVAIIDGLDDLKATYISNFGKRRSTFVTGTGCGGSMLRGSLPEVVAS